MLIGPMIGHTTSKSIRVWLRADAEMRMNGVRTTARLYDNGMLIEEQDFLFLQNDNDFIGLIEFGTDSSLLTPDTTYRYTIEIDQDGLTRKLFEGNVKTFSSDLHKEVTFITGSCRHLYVKNDSGQSLGYMQQHSSDIAYGDQAFYTIENFIKEKEGFDPQFFLMTGDQVYADHEPGSFHGNGHPAKSFEEYLDHYHRAYPQTHFASLAKKMPFYMTMDDHEIKNDWMMDMIYPYYDKDADENLRHYKNGLHAYAIYQAALSPVIKNPKDLDAELNKLADISYEKNLAKNIQPYTDSSKGLFYTFEQGAGKFFCMDVRTERYMHKDTPQMIGKYQLQALYNWLSDHKENEKVKFIVTSVPIFPDTKSLFGASEDKWGGYAEQRKEILDYIRKQQIKKVIFISGDVHVSLAAKLQYQGEDTGIYSVISSAFTWPVPGLQGWNFDWKPLPERSILKGAFWKKDVEKKRKPDTKSRGDYCAIPLTRWKLFDVRHKKHNFCYIRTDGNNLYVSFYSSKNGKLIEELDPIKL